MPSPIPTGPIAAELLRNADTHAAQYSLTGEHLTAAAIAELAEILTGDEIVASPVPGPGWTVTVHWAGMTPAPEETTHVLLGWNYRGEPVFLDDVPPRPYCLTVDDSKRGHRLVSVNAPVAGAR
jgi:hypothetical protein